MKLPSDFAAKIAAVLNVRGAVVEDYFEIDEDKQGYFYAKLKPNKWLEKPQFQALCGFVDGLEGMYIKEQKLWRVPGPMAKSPQKPSEHGMDSERTYKEAGNAITKEPSAPEGSVEPEVSDEYFIATSIPKIGYLYPVLKDAHGNIIDGIHRKNIDPKWPEQKLDHITDPVQLAIARLVANVCRRDVPGEEKTEWLRQIATMTGWTPKQIAENLPVSYPWVMKYIPDEFKERPGVGFSELSVIRRIAQHEPVKTVQCAKCSVAVENPVHYRGKFYCNACATAIIHPEPEEPAEEESKEEPLPKEGLKEQLPTALPTAAALPTTLPTPETRAPEPEPLDIGSFECPQCHEHYRIIHLANNLHRLEKVKTA